MKNKKGFTLIEMLVVVLIIAILMGIAYRILGFGKGAAERAATIKNLELLRHAIEEYRAIYGQYPPVNPKYVWKDSIDFLMPDASPNGHFSPGNFNNSPAATPGNNTYFFDPDKPMVQFGLLGYFMPRVKCDDRYDWSTSTYVWMDNWEWRHLNLNLAGGVNRNNTKRDEYAWNKIKPYVDDIIIPKEIDKPKPGKDNCEERWHTVAFPRTGTPRKYGGFYTTSKPSYLLAQFTVNDGWDKGGKFKYRSEPPHSSYRLWWQNEPEDGYLPNNTDPDPNFKHKASDIIEGHVGH